MAFAARILLSELIFLIFCLNFFFHLSKSLISESFRESSSEKLFSLKINSAISFRSFVISQLLSFWVFSDENFIIFFERSSFNSILEIRLSTALLITSFWSNSISYLASIPSSYVKFLTIF